MEYYGVTDVGKRRHSNQDCFVLKDVCGYLVAVVCDGMGGANGGKIASEVACETFSDSLCTRIEEIYKEDPASLPGALDKLIRSAIDSANDKIYKLSLKNRDLAGMGTTLVGCVLHGQDAAVFNIGDSGLYHVQGNDVKKLTKDHSLVQALIDAGQLTEAEAVHHPNKNVITRVVGVDEHVEADLAVHKIESGYLLLCSDGLSNYSLIVAVCFALLVPNIIEKRAQRKINTARVTMVITLCIVLVAYFIYAGVRSGFTFRA